MKTTTLLTGMLTVAIGASAFAMVGASHDPIGHQYRTITRGELAQMGGANAYDAVTDLRSLWLGESTHAHIEEPTVLIQLRCRKTACLRWIDVGQVEKVDFLDPNSLHQTNPLVLDGPTIIVSMRTAAPEIETDTTSR